MCIFDIDKQIDVDMNTKPTHDALISLGFKTKKTDGRSKKSTYYELDDRMEYWPETYEGRICVHGEPAKNTLVTWYPDVYIIKNPSILAIKTAIIMSKT